MAASARPDPADASRARRPAGRARRHDPPRSPTPPVTCSRWSRCHPAACGASRTTAPPFMLADAQLSAPAPAPASYSRSTMLDQLRARLPGPGPAGVADAQAWSGLSRLRKSRLGHRAFTSRTARTCWICRTRRAAPGRPRHTRFLPEYDNLLLCLGAIRRRRRSRCSRARRDRGNAARRRPVAIWKISQGALEMEPFISLSRRPGAPSRPRRSCRLSASSPPR